MSLPERLTGTRIQSFLTLVFYAISVLCGTFFYCLYDLTRLDLLHQKRQNEYNEEKHAAIVEQLELTLLRKERELRYRTNRYYNIEYQYRALKYKEKHSISKRINRTRR